jgi:hypothetical protein
MNRDQRLEKHFLSSYFNLRVGIAILALLFPMFLWIGGALQGIGIQDSMSAYYHAAAGDRSMRDFFVGILFAVGVFLFLYKGYSPLENGALNLAGILAVIVAIFPMQWNCGDECRRISVHGISAISLFLCIAFVCIFCRSDTLSSLKDERLKTQYSATYWTLGVFMVLSPLAAFLFAVVFRRLHGYTFLAETFGIAVFAIYWLVKSRELSLSKIEHMTFSGAKP